MNNVALPAALRAVPGPVLEEYVQARLSNFVDLMVQRLLHHEPTLNPLVIQRAITDVLSFLPPPAPLPMLLPPPPTEPQQQFQLVFRHDCMALGCLDPQCSLCQHNPQRRCTVNFDRKYLVNDVLKAKCSATIRVELIERETGRLVDQELAGLRLEVCVLDGHAYDAKFLEGNRAIEGGCEPEDELESCCLLLNKKKNTPLLVSGAMATNDTSGRLILALQHGRAVLPDVSITDSSEAILLGRKPPFRLLVRANWLPVSSGGARPAPRPLIRHAISEGFVVATRRTRTAGKVDIPSVEDPVSKLEHMGKETVKKLQDIGLAAQQAGVEIRIPENCVTKVGDFKQLALRADQDGHLRQRLQHVLKLSKEKWEEAREHALRAVVSDSRPRAWYTDSLACDMGLLFTCRLGSVDLERPMALLQAVGGRGPNGEPRMEATLMAQLTPAQRDLSRQLLAQAAHCWWRGAHPGWAIFSEGDLAGGVVQVAPPGSAAASGQDGGSGGGGLPNQLQLGRTSSPQPAPGMIGPPGKYLQGSGVRHATATGVVAPPGAPAHPPLYPMHSGGSQSGGAPPFQQGHVNATSASGIPAPNNAFIRPAPGPATSAPGGASNARTLNPFADVATAMASQPRGHSTTGASLTSSPTHSASGAQQQQQFLARGGSLTGAQPTTTTNTTGSQLAKRSAADMLQPSTNSQPGGGVCSASDVAGSRPRTSFTSNPNMNPDPSSPSHLNGSGGLRVNHQGVPPQDGQGQPPCSKERLGPAHSGSGTAGAVPPGLKHDSNNSLPTTTTSSSGVAVPPPQALSPALNHAGHSPHMTQHSSEPNPFASLMAAHHVVGGGTGMPMALPERRGMPSAGCTPASFTTQNVSTTPTFDLGALPSLPFQSMTHHQQQQQQHQQQLALQQARAAAERGSIAPGSNLSPSQQDETHGVSGAVPGLKHLPSLGVGSFLGSADLDAVLGGLGAPGLAENMETSLTGLGLNTSLNMASFLQQGGNSMWIPPNLFNQQSNGVNTMGPPQPHASQQPLQLTGWGGAGNMMGGYGNAAAAALQGGMGHSNNGHFGGGGAGVGNGEALNTVTSGLDNMQSIEQALPQLDNDTSMQLLAAAQRASHMARVAQSH